MVRRLLDIYAPVVGADQSVDTALRRLRERVLLEVRVQEELMAMQGMLEALLAAAYRGGGNGGRSGTEGGAAGGGTPGVRPAAAAIASR